MKQLRILKKLFRSDLISNLDLTVWLLLNFAIFLEAWFRIPSRFKWTPEDPTEQTIESAMRVNNKDVTVDSIQIINWEQSYGKNGILSRMAVEMCSAAKKRRIRLIESDFPDRHAAIIHQIYFRTALPIRGIPSTVMVTHVDTYLKKVLLNWQRKRGLHPIFMSRQSATMSSGSHFGPSDVVAPPPARILAKRKLKIGFFTNVYSDGRKREDILLEAVREVDEQWISLFMMGSGLEQLATACQNIGVEVKLTSNFELEKYMALLSDIDLLIYTGIDEGAISTLDAISAGVPVAVPSIGFNRMLQHSKVKFFNDSRDLTKVIQEFVQEKISLAECLPTKNSLEYFDQHLKIWVSVLNKPLSKE